MTMTTPDSDESERAAAAGGPAEPVVLSYARTLGSYEGTARRSSRFVVMGTVALFLFTLCAGSWNALLIPPVGAVVYVGCRLIEDGHRPVWLAVVVALLSGVAMVSVGLQAADVASDPGHPQSRWRPALFKPSLVAVPALVGTVVASRRVQRGQR
jgi:hypothetical protein